MNAIASLTIENGRVSMSETDWRAHLEAMEDAEDRAAYDLAKAENARDPFRWTLAEVVETLNGKHPIAVLRARTGMTQAALAKAAGLSRANLAMIESNRQTGSLTASLAIAKALGVAVEVIVPET